jgi:WD40 repeat protein
MEVGGTESGSSPNLLGGDDATVRLWDLVNRSAKRIELTDHEGSVESVAFSPDGQTLTTGDDAKVRLWNLGATNPATDLRILPGTEDGIESVAFGPDGQTLASGSRDKTVRPWGLGDPSAMPLALRGHEATVYSVALSPDGRSVASGGTDATVPAAASHAPQERLLSSSHSRCACRRKQA